jgi:hypothetical protein
VIALYHFQYIFYLVVVLIFYKFIKLISIYLLVILINNKIHLVGFDFTLLANWTVCLLKDINQSKKCALLFNFDQQGVRMITIKQIVSVSRLCL